MINLSQSEEQMSHHLSNFRLSDLRSCRPQIGLALFFLTACSLGSAATLCVNKTGTSGCKTTISAAVAAAAYRDTILVGSGTYKEQVTITNAVSLVAVNPLDPPVIDAKGLNNGVYVNGLAAAPGEGVLYVVIKGFEIKGANYEGILVVNGSDITIEGNHVHDNNKGLDLSSTPVTCPGIPAFETNEGSDCGEGIHLIGTNRSTIIHNESDHNSGGILITDETGPSDRNLVSSNFVHDNPYACGITMASHGPYPVPAVPFSKFSYGVFRNTVQSNESAHNGLGLPGAGAGVGIFAAVPGYASYENSVLNNDLHDNGLPGVTMHSHANFPTPLNPPYLNDNVIVGNHIHGNAADTADATTSGPTGINIFGVGGIHGTVISQNVFDDEAIDIAVNVPTGQFDAHFNNFSAASVGIANLAGGSITATENWWHCPGGPAGTGSACATVSGDLVGGPAPWLALPFAP